MRASLHVFVCVCGDVYLIVFMFYTLIWLSLIISVFPILLLIIAVVVVVAAVVIFRIYLSFYET